VIDERKKVPQGDFEDYCDDQWYLNQMKDSVGIFFGAHAEDAANWAYPDCTPEFIGAMANAIYVGTYYTVRLYTPIMWMSKAEVVRWGNELQVPFDMTWSCYKGGDLQCGECPTCISRHNAFLDAGIPDPTTYAVRPRNMQIGELV
jgi:7-cyano-7-deazaguanine synthase